MPRGARRGIPSIGEGSAAERGGRPDSGFPSRLRLGESATVAFIHTPRHAYLQRLHGFGLAPGRRIRLRQTRPALVTQVGETELALDTKAGHEIFVKRHPDAVCRSASP